MFPRVSLEQVPAPHGSHWAFFDGAGAVGKDAADEKGNLRRQTNLQYGVVACRAADMFLLASDGCVRGL